MHDHRVKLSFRHWFDVVRLKVLPSAAHWATLVKAIAVAIGGKWDESHNRVMLGERGNYAASLLVNADGLKAPTQPSG